jgi:hypothetical protein
VAVAAARGMQGLPAMVASQSRPGGLFLVITAPLLLAACGPASAAPTPDDEPPSRPADAVRIRMQDHFDELRAIERRLLRGDLDGARDQAVAIAFDRVDRDLPAWGPHIVRMQAAAAALARARTLEEACHAETRLALECAGCHAASGAMPTFVVAPLPADDGTTVARMARHQWAADRLWEGLVGLSDEAWRSGADLIATAPPPALTPPRRRGAAALRSAARRARAATTPAGRARAYGALLVTCTGCHAAVDD